MPLQPGVHVCLVLSLTAVLTDFAVGSGDVPRREVATEVSLSLRLVDGATRACAISAWSGVGLEGSCGSFRWEQLEPASALRVVKSVVSAKDADAAEDALAVLLAHPDASRLSSPGVAWARGLGVDDAGVARARAEADALRSARKAEIEAARATDVARTTPELGLFPSTRWAEVDLATFQANSAAVVEAARALLARAGGSATLHETEQLALLAESSSDVHAADAAWLATRLRAWGERFALVGAAPQLQARIVVVQVANRDRWRQIVAAAFGGDAARHTESVTVYPEVVGGTSFRGAIVLVAPGADRSQLRAAAATGVARALLHYTASPVRPPAFVNEALPLVLADVAVPEAGLDARLRRQAVPMIRAGRPILPTVRAAYGDPAWIDRATETREWSYVFVRWLWDNESERLLRFAKGDGGWGAASVGGVTPTLDTRFARTMGITLESACAAAARWFATND